MKIHFLICLGCFNHSISCLSQPLNYKTWISRDHPALGCEKPRNLNDGIRTSTLKKVRMNENIIRAMEDSIRSGVYTNIHSILILRHNLLVYENYFPGEDQARGIGSLGYVAHHQDSLHDIRSVSKSVTSAAVMIAVGQGKINNLNCRVFDFFPEYARYDTGLKSKITIQHLLNMSSGLEWNEGISYSDTLNSERRMNRAANVIEFILGRNMAAEPGSTFNYNGGCTELLKAILERVSGMDINRFTQQFLFKPLGINKWIWTKTDDGGYSAASGLRLRSRDMAKFGLIYLNNGIWKKKQIIPPDLAAYSLKSQISTPDSSATYHLGYSNQFWIYNEVTENAALTWVQCQGNGGQIIIIDKAFDLVLVITAGNYNKNVQKGSWDIYPDFIYPSLEK